MENKNLKNIIGILYDMELNNYLMTRALQNLKKKMSGLGYSYEYEKPEMAEITNHHDGILSVSLFAGFCGIGPGAIIGFSVATSKATGSAIDYFFDHPETALPGVLLGMLIGALAGFFVCYLLKHTAATSEEEYERNRAEERYRTQIAVYNKKTAENNRRVKSELNQKKYLLVQYKKLSDKIEQSKNLLKSFYNKADIDVRFRNIISMGYMNEFVILGISDKLEGTEGLYYLIMKELRWDQLNATLEDISAKLDTIIDNQKRIYFELQNMNAKCDSIISGISNLAYRIDENTELQQTIAVNSEISAYYSQRTAKEAEFSNYMNLYC